MKISNEIRRKFKFFAEKPPQNAAIGVLAALALLQTARLWFGADLFEIVSRKAASVYYITDEIKKPGISNPRSVVSTAGDGAFCVRFNGLSANEGKKNGDVVLSEIFFKGAFVSGNKLNYLNVLARGCIIFDYALNVPANVFIESLAGEKKINAAASRVCEKITGFNAAVIIPDGQGGNVTALFVNEEKNMVYEYFVTVGAPAADALRRYIAEQAEYACFLSTAREGITASGENVFLPRRASEMPCAALRAADPYTSADGVKTLKSVQKQIEPLFAQTSIMQITPDETSYRYANEANTVIKYSFKNTLLEYSDYGAATGGAAQSSIHVNYAAALDFIAKDPSVANEFYLCAYAFDGRAYTFRFNFAVNDAPVFLSGTIKAETALTSAMEITVENTHIVKYRRFALTFNAAPAAQAPVALDAAAFKSRLENGQTAVSARNITCGYVFDFNGNGALRVIFENGGDTLTEPVFQ